MPSRGQTLTVSFVAWDNTANVGKTGDAANFTLKWIKDGTAATPTNVPATEVDSTNAPGLYKLTLTGTECTCDFGTLAGKSSTSGISILPISVSFEQLPTAAPNASGGLLTFGTSTGQISPVSGGVDLRTILGTASQGAAGYLGVDWGHVNAPTTAVNLSGTTISTTQAVASVSGNVGGNVAGSVGSISGVTFPTNFGTQSIDTNGAVKIQGQVKKNTALAGFAFYLALASDHVSPATGKTVTATRSLDGGAFAACANSVSEISGGWYQINLAATDLNANVIALSFAASSSDTTVLTVVTQP